MKRLVLFSSPKGKNFEEIVEKIFPAEIKNKVFAYIPTLNKYLNQEFTDKWQEIATSHNAEFRFIDVQDKDVEKVRESVQTSNIILMTGGNTFWLLDYLRKTGIDKVILEVAQKPDFVISGWSAGAMVMTPTIAVGGLPSHDGGKSPMDENKVGLTDLTGFNLVNFEIFPHFDESTQKQTLENYKKESPNEVKALTDDEFIIVDL